MDLHLRFPAGKEWISDEHLAMAGAVKRWAEREVMAKRQSLREDHERLLMPALKILQRDLGLGCMLWDQEDGLPLADAAVTMTLVTEQVARADLGLAWIMATSLAPAAAIRSRTSPPASGELEPLARLFAGGDAPAVCALVLECLDAGGGEPAALHDGRRLQARARQTTSGWVIDGDVMRPLGCGVDATIFAVLCQVEGRDRPGLFVVPGDAPGITRGGEIKQTGLAAARNANITFAGVEAPASGQCLVEVTDLAALRSWLDLLASAASVGAMAAGFELLADWGDSRVIKGRGQLLRDNQLAASLMADLAQRIIICRRLVLDLARTLGRPDLHGHAGADDVHLTCRTVAHHVTRSAEAGIDHAMELMGSAGYATEWNLERYWRDLRTLRAQLGSRILGRMGVARHYYGSKADMIEGPERTQ